MDISEFIERNEREETDGCQLLPFISSSIYIYICIFTKKETKVDI